jgi:hypothetical protein
MRDRETKIDQRPVAKIASKIPLKASEDLSTEVVVGLDHFTEFFKLNLLGEYG